MSKLKELSNLIEAGDLSKTSPRHLIQSSVTVARELKEYISELASRELTHGKAMSEFGSDLKTLESILNLINNNYNRWKDK